MHHINHLLPSKLPVRQNGCVKEAEGVKYFSMVLRWVEGGDCVRRWIIWGISASVVWVSGWVFWHDGTEFTWVFHGRGALWRWRAKVELFRCLDKGDETR